MLPPTGPSFYARLSRPECFQRPEPPPPPPEPKFRYFMGLDVGQAGEFTALAVIERTATGECVAGRQVFHHAVRHLQRFTAGTSYAEIVGVVKTMFADRPLKGGMLIVDVTAVGRPVLDLLYDAHIDGGVMPVSITAGQYAAVDERGGWLVPRKELASLLQLLLQGRRLKVAEALPEAALLTEELANFRVRAPLVAADDVLAWREGVHDDLVLAVGIAAWEAERYYTPDVKWIC
jgi:hypothetical protein